MAERAGWNTGPFDTRILSLLENKSEIQISVSERTLGDCQSDAGFPRRGRRGAEGAEGGQRERAGGDRRAASSNVPPLECQTQGVASNSSANELDFSANLCSNVTVFE
jgi:hypothetical protein